MTPEQEQFIRERFDSMSVESLRRLFNEHFGTNWKSTGFNYHTHKLGLRKCELHKYTEKEELFLEKFSSLLTREQLTKAFNKEFNTKISVDAIAMRCWQKGLKPFDDGKFKKGGVPWAKCKGGKDEYFSKLIKGPNSGSFKKGNIPPSLKPVGTESYSKKYGIKVKTESGWKLKHILVWEENFGSVEKNEVVIFADGNKSNFDPSNLRKVSNRTFVRLHSNGWLDCGNPILLDTAISYCELANLLKEPRKS